MSKMFQGAYIIGGIESRFLDALAERLVRDAQEADGQPSAAERSRHVNTMELAALCRDVLQRLAGTKGAPQA